MTADKCRCGKHEDRESCEACRRDELFSYWCTSCNRSVPEKRCPYCGLKAQKKRG